jgi:hypothetical protein
MSLNGKKSNAREAISHRLFHQAEVWICGEPSRMIAHNPFRCTKYFLCLILRVTQWEPAGCSFDTRKCDSRCCCNPRLVTLSKRHFAFGHNCIFPFIEHCLRSRHRVHCHLRRMQLCNHRFDEDPQSKLVYIIYSISNLTSCTATASTADLTSSFSSYPIPSPTILFITPAHFRSTWTDIATVAKGSFLASLAYRHKISALAEGFLSKDGLWDRTVFDAARAKIIGEGAGTVRAVIVTGKDLPAKDLPDARVTLSIPVVHAVSHPAVVAPVCATHPLDLQHFPAPANAQGFDAVAHAGPPSVNLEAKLIGIDDTATQAGQDPEGTLLVRGPTVAKVEIIGDEASAEIESGWLNTWDKVRVLTNGCFKFLP